MMELIFRHTPTTKRKNKSYFTKTPPLFIAKTARIKKKFYSNDDIMCVMSCNSRFVQ